MTQKQLMISFLEDLSVHNSKEWMDENRKRYHEAKDIWLDEVQEILNKLADLNPGFAMVNPKQTISRINNNRRFQPDKPIYKDFFSCEPSGKGTAQSMFYFAIGKSWSFTGGGMHNPEKEQLAAFRNAIDYDGEEFHSLVQAKEFQQVFGGLTSFTKPLKTAPKGFAKDHPWIEYLRLKSITATRDISKEEFLSDSFQDLIVRAYAAFQPMEEYLYRSLQAETA